MKPPKYLDLDIESIAFEGKAVAHTDGTVVFVHGAVPGDRVRARVVGRRKQFLEARAIEILSPSPLRVAPPCAHFGPCGGCSWQHFEYAAQLSAKAGHVREAIERLGGLDGIPFEEIVPAPDAYRYRNKMEFSFSDDRWLEEGETNNDPVTLGLHVRQNYHKLVRVERCWLQSERANAVLAATRAFVLARGLGAYHSKHHTGYLRFLAIRETTLGEMMVNLVTADDRPVLIGEYAAALLAACPFVTTIVNNITAKTSQVAVGERERTVHGSGVIREKMCGLEFVISANSFFQTNSRQGERLYGLAIEFARLEPGDSVWDLYSGTGTISLAVAPHASRVVGVELVAQAVADARRNAEQNGIANVRFVESDLRLYLLKPDEPTPSVVILDPPRAGTHPDIIKRLLQLMPSRIVYVSCNPATLARDLKELATLYTIDRVRPVDMFPQTWHIEAVAQLTRKQV